MFLFVFNSHSFVLRKVKKIAILSKNHLPCCNILRTSSEIPKIFLKTLHLTYSKLLRRPTTHTRTHTGFTPFCAHVSTVATCPHSTEIFACVCGRADPRPHPQGPVRPPHLTLTSVRKYVYMPHQRRGVVVVVNEKALV